MRRFIESFLDARAILSPPREPTLPNPQVDDPESQDYADFDFGIDLNDPTTLAQLDDTEDAVAFVKEKEQGELADKVCRVCFLCDPRLTEISGDFSLFLGFLLEDPEILRKSS